MPDSHAEIHGPPTTGPPDTRMLGRFAAIGVAAFAAGFAAMHFIQADLDPIESFGSQYAYGRAGWLLNLSFFAAGLGVLALAAGLWRSLAAGERVGASAVLMVLVGVGFIGSGVFVTDPPLEDGDALYTLSSQLHALFGVVLFGSLIVGTFLLAGVFRRDGRWVGFAGTTLAFAWAILVLFVATVVAAGIAPPGTGGISGLVQRVFIATLLTWLFLTARQVERIGGAGAA